MINYIFRSKTKFCIAEAVKAKHLPVVRTLALAGCNMDLPEREYLYSPLHNAILMATQVKPFRDNIDDAYEVSTMLKVI